MKNDFKVFQKRLFYKALSQIGLLVILLLIGLTACVFQEKATQTASNLSSVIPSLTPIPVVQIKTETPFPPTVTPTSELPSFLLTPIPFNTLPSTREIMCALDISSITPTPNILDSITPGVTTKQDVEQLLGLPSSEVIWGGQIQWYYQSLTGIIFENDVVIERDDLRWYLGEIVGQYGVPEQVIWQVPKSNYHFAVPRTYLLYPIKGLLFMAEGEIITIFAEDSFFGLSIVVEPTRFDEVVTIHSDHDWVIPIDWPCPSE